MNKQLRDTDPVKGMCLFNYNNLKSQNCDHSNSAEKQSYEDHTSVIQKSLTATIAERGKDIWQPPVD